MTSPALSLPFSFSEPIWLWLVLVIPVLVLFSRKSLAGLEPPRRAAALLVRALVIVAVVFCLAGIQYVRRHDDLTVIFLMDRSHSVERLEADQESFVLQASDGIRPNDRVGLIAFARSPYVQQPPMRGGYHVAEGRLPPMANTDRTDIAASLRLAMAIFPHDTAKRIVLMSDGNDNMGDVLTEARRARANGIPVDVRPLQYQRGNEVYFERMIAPTFAEPGEQVALRMVLATQEPVSGTIMVYRNNELLDLPPEATRVNLEPGRNTFFLKLPVQSETTQSYEAIFRPDDESADAVALNNSARAFTFVSGKSRLLVISPNPAFDTPLAEALRSENVLVDLKSTDELGEFTLPDMMGYSSILLANVPAASFTEEQQEALATYVKDMGSGLIMTGGDESFGAGGWIGTPIEEVMPVSFEIKHKRVIPRGALVLIMHSCEVARGNFWGKEMSKKSVDTISSQDYIGVLAYSYSPGGENWEVPLDLNTNKAAVKARIDRMQIGDMPDFATTMQMAYDELVRGKGRDAAQKHVIILSDGDAQRPSDRLLQDYVEAKVTVSTIAIGWGGHVFEPTMRDIARKTGGEFYAPRNPKQLPQIFMKESKVVRRPLIIEEAFVPQVLQTQSDLLVGISSRSELPPLEGMVLTSRKESPNVFLPLVRATEDGLDPVLAHWQYELGKTVAFTSGYWPRWGTSWTQWERFAKLWAQVVRWSMRQDTPANFDTYTRVEGDKGHVVIDALDKDASYLNNLLTRARVIGPDNQPIPVTFVQTGPGKYEAEFDATRAGQYIANVQLYDGDRSLGTVRTGLAVPFSPEYRDLATNEALLRQVAEVSGGRWLDTPAAEADVFSHDLPPAESRRPAWEWVLAWVLLPAFLLDVAVRRLASWLALSLVVEILILVVLWFGLGWWWQGAAGVLGAIIVAELVGWAIRFRYIPLIFDFLTHPTVVLERAGERGAASLERLKGTRERTKAEREAAARAELDSIAEPLEPPAPQVARQKYDVGDRAGRKPAGDLTHAVGGAKAASPDTDKTSSGGKPGESKAGGDESSMSRLLRAKKRARSESDQEGK